MDDTSEVLGRLGRLVAELIRTTRPRRFGEGREALIGPGDLVFLDQLEAQARALRARNIEGEELAASAGQVEAERLERDRWRGVMRERVATDLAAGHTVARVAGAIHKSPAEVRGLLREALADGDLVERLVFSGSYLRLTWPRRRAELEKIARGAEQPEAEALESMT
jgi:hypothetical protein